MNSLRDLGFLFRDIARLSSKDFERHVADLDLSLTLTQWRMLAYLERNAGISQARLAELTDTDPMTLARQLARLERGQWIERHVDTADRRARTLHLGAAAPPMLRTLWAVADQVREDALAGLDDAARRQLLELLHRVRDNLSGVLPAESPAVRVAQSGGPDRTRVNA